MKRYILVAVVMFLVDANFANAQKTEINVNASSGLFSYYGKGATTNSAIGWYQFDDPHTYTSNPFGKKNQLSYTIELQIQRVLKNKNIYGVGLGYEYLSSKVQIDWQISSAFAYIKTPINGITIVKNKFITAYPFVGHRFSFQNVKMDLQLGMDMAYTLESTESAWATHDTKSSPLFQNDIDKPFVDFRPRVQIKTSIKKFGLLAAYSIGLNNYYYKNNLPAKTNFLRFGIIYQIK